MVKTQSPLLSTCSNWTCCSCATNVETKTDELQIPAARRKCRRMQQMRMVTKSYQKKNFIVPMGIYILGISRYFWRLFNSNFMQKELQLFFAKGGIVDTALA
jgi:hypothetical protein